MRLLSLNVGQTAEIEWRGQKVRTAIWKHPVEGRRQVRRLNVDGDGQADLVGHGGEQRAVFVYQMSPTATGPSSSAATMPSTASSARTSR